MKKRLSGFVNNINKVVDSVTKTIEDIGSGVKGQGQSNEAEKSKSIIDRLPTGEGAQKKNTSFSETIKKPEPPKPQHVQQPKPPVIQNTKNVEPTEKAEAAVYFMYVCPECRKVFRTKGNDKKVKCSHCDGTYLKDTHVSEVVWRSYSKEERDKIISNLLDEEVFEEVFEEPEEKKEEKKPTRSSYFDDDGLLMGAASTDDSSFYNSYSSTSNNTSSSSGFFSGYDNFNNDVNISRSNTGTYYNTSYSNEKNTRSSSLGKPLFTCVLLLMIGVLVFIGSNVLKVKKQLDEETYSGEIVNEVANETYAEEPTHNSYEENDTADNYVTDNYTENNYVSEEPTYSDGYEDTSESYSSNNEDSYYQDNNSTGSYEDTGNYYEDDYDTSEEEYYEEEETGTEYYWILNTNTKKIHYPSCGSVNQMKEKNKQISHESLEELERRGYSRCGNCF